MNDKRVLVIGAGPIIIGQGCEFDYAGTQACEQLLREGFEVILINSNPATVMTDPAKKVKIYFEAPTLDNLIQIIEIDKPNYIFAIAGGQTGLNALLMLNSNGLMEKYNITPLGPSIEAIQNTEDRELFIKKMNDINMKTSKNEIITNINQYKKLEKNIGFPMIIRPSFTLGGEGGGIAYNTAELEKLISSAIKHSPIQSAQVDQSLIGWKEYEFECIRDQFDNSIIVCCIENIDPVGVHTGDSIAISPAITITDKLFQTLRTHALEILKAVNFKSGAANIQFAVNPKNSDIVVIEMNSRLSRSSTLASKVTCYPIAKVATMLAVGKSLSEIKIDVVNIPASMEPALDYIVFKSPRFDFEKFKYEDTLSTAMRSIGESISVSQTFAQAMLKSIVALECNLTGLDERPENTDIETLKNNLGKLKQNKLLDIADAIRAGMSVKSISSLSFYDEWFIGQVKLVVDIEKLILDKKDKILKDPELLWKSKAIGISDARIAKLIQSKEETVIKARHKLKIHPVYKGMDPSAGEVACNSGCFYSAYSENICTEMVPSDKKKVVILGSGCNRIGQGLEFDHTCVHVSKEIQKVGYEAIMVNSNPSTVSTDFEKNNKLYLEPITLEHIIEILIAESKCGEVIGVFIQSGGQTPIKLARGIENFGFKILGTSTDSIEKLEKRTEFVKILNELNIPYPQSCFAKSFKDLKEAINKIGYPVLLRPSYVIGGTGIFTINSNSELDLLISTHGLSIFESGNVILDKLIPDAIEIDVDAIGCNKKTFILGITEQIEEAGIHSGDSICTLPAITIKQEMLEKIKDIVRKIISKLQIYGFINFQFALKDDEIYLLESNPRASRTVPFIAKTTMINASSIAVQAIFTKTITEGEATIKYYAVKMPVFPFNKFITFDPILTPQMKSTGEAIGIDENLYAAMAKSFMSTGIKIPKTGTALLSVRDEDKTKKLIDIANMLQDNEFKIIATYGTKSFLEENGMKNISLIGKMRHRRPNVEDTIINKNIDILINTTDSTQIENKKEKTMRILAISNGLPVFTNLNSATIFLKAVESIKQKKISIHDILYYKKHN